MTKWTFKVLYEFSDLRETETISCYDLYTSLQFSFHLSCFAWFYNQINTKCCYKCWLDLAYDLPVLCWNGSEIPSRKLCNRHFVWESSSILQGREIQAFTKSFIIIILQVADDNIIRLSTWSASFNRQVALVTSHLYHMPQWSKVVWWMSHYPLCQCTSCGKAVSTSGLTLLLSIALLKSHAKSPSFLIRV